MATKQTMASRWLAYHEAHPEVYTAFRAAALRLRARGYRHAGSKMIFEALRFQSMLDARDARHPWKLCNNYTAYYARFLMEQEPAIFRDFFELRPLRAA
jgi:hypothetical protein